MAPEFVEGEVIVVEPEGIAKDGAFVVAWANDEYIFRQLVHHPEGWMLKPINPIYPNIPIDDVKETVKGVVVLKKKPGRRRESKRYD
jgi:SOS-response transcriptional repressor LexA